MENPVSWAVLVIFAVMFAIWFAMKVDSEISQYRAENDRFFWEIEHGYRRR